MILASFWRADALKNFRNLLSFPLVGNLSCELAKKDAGVAYRQAGKPHDDLATFVDDCVI